MSLTKIEKTTIIKNHGSNPGDTGSPEVQIALLTADIKKLTEHFKTHKKDVHSRQGLIRKVNLRRTLMKFLRRKNPEGYQKLIKELGIRG